MLRRSGGIDAEDERDRRVRAKKTVAAERSSAELFLLYLYMSTSLFKSQAPPPELIV